MPLTSLLQTLADALPPVPTAAEIDAVAAVLARLASERPTPRKSLALLDRHHLRRLSAAIRLLLKGRALEIIHSQAPQHAPHVDIVTPGWVDLDTAATLLGLPVKHLLDRLRYPQCRRAWGWPRCIDGSRRWSFPLDAISGAASAAVLASMPMVEPPHGLPVWAKRVDEVNMVEWPACGT